MCHISAIFNWIFAYFKLPNFTNWLNWFFSKFNSDNSGYGSPYPVYAQIMYHINYGDMGLTGMVNKGLILAWI